MFKTLSLKGTSQKVKDWTDELVLFCVRADFNNEKSANELREILSDKIDWQRALENLSRHGLSLVFYRLLVAANFTDRIPSEVLESLRSTYRRAVARNLIQEKTLKTVFSSFASAEIPLMVPKGIYLDQKIYCCKDIRPSADIDLFTKEECLIRARNLFLGLGFKQVPNHELAFQRDGFPTVFFEVEAFRKQTKAWFRETYLLDSEDIWRQANIADLCGARIYQMRAEHLLLYLCLHLAERHHFERLIWIRDLKEVIDHYGEHFDWGYLVDCAESWRAQTYTYFSLLLARKLALAAVPASVLSQLRPNYLSARLFEKTVFINGFPRLPMKTSSLRFQLLSVLGDKFTRRLWAEIIFPYHAALRLLRSNRKRIRQGGMKLKLRDELLGSKSMGPNQTKGAMEEAATIADRR